MEHGQALPAAGSPTLQVAPGGRARRGGVALGARASRERADYAVVTAPLTTVAPVPDAADAALVADLEAALDRDRVNARPLELALYSRDASMVGAGEAAAVCFPVSAEEVQACVRIARRHGRPFVPRGSGTGLAGGAVPSAGRS